MTTATEIAMKQKEGMERIRRAREAIKTGDDFNVMTEEGHRYRVSYSYSEMKMAWLLRVVNWDGLVRTWMCMDHHDVRRQFESCVADAMREDAYNRWVAETLLGD